RDVRYGGGGAGGMLGRQVGVGACVGLLAVVGGAKLAPTHGFSIVLWSIAGMAAILAATVRAPLTGVALVIEMTGCLPAGFMALVAAAPAALTARTLGGRPIYQTILQRPTRAAGPRARGAAASAFRRSAQPRITTKKAGTKRTARHVEASMPLATARPSDLRAEAPAPRARSKGRTPRMNVNDVMTIGRKRTSEAWTV